MEKTYNPVSACFRKGPATDEKQHLEISTGTNDSEMKQTDCATGSKQQQVTGNIAWRLTSGLYSVGTGAANLAFNGAKWAAVTSYGVGAAAVGTGVNTVKKFTGKSKDKNE